MFFCFFFVEVKLVYTLQGKLYHYILTPFYTPENIKQSQKKKKKKKEFTKRSVGNCY